jgi:hypothetical protein
MFVKIWTQQGQLICLIVGRDDQSGGEIDVCLVYTSDNSCTHSEPIV